MPDDRKTYTITAAWYDAKKGAQSMRTFRVKAGSVFGAKDKVAGQIGRPKHSSYTLRGVS